MLVFLACFSCFSFLSFCFVLFCLFACSSPFFLILFHAIAVLIGWPFVFLLALPIGLDLLLHFSLLDILLCCFKSLLICLLPSVIIDFYFYHKVMLAPLNIFLYNFGTTGPSLYGEEPWHFYFANLSLNFNLIFVFALAVGCYLLVSSFLSPLSSLLTSSSRTTEKKSDEKDRAPSLIDSAHHHHLQRLQRLHRSLRFLLYLSPFYLWFLAMSKLAHKEERFLFVVYPLICFGAALFCDEMQTVCQLWLNSDSVSSSTSSSSSGSSNVPQTEITQSTTSKDTVETEPSPLRSRKIFTSASSFSSPSLRIHPKSSSPCFSFSRFFARVGLFHLHYIIPLIILLLCISRDIAIFRNFSAPFFTYSYLCTYITTSAYSSSSSSSVHVCVGKEWHRFPSSFFLPPSASLHFIPSNFSGLLPSTFAKWEEGGMKDPRRRGEEKGEG